MRGLCNYEYKYLKYVYELYLYMNSIFLKILMIENVGVNIIIEKFCN